MKKKKRSNKEEERWGGTEEELEIVRHRAEGAWVDLQGYLAHKKQPPPLGLP